MDLSQLPAHELGAAFESHSPPMFQAWVLDRSAEIVQAARRVHGDAQRSSPSVNNISPTDAVIVNNMLGYAKNLEMLHINLSGLTMRLMVHNPGQTATQVQQLDGWRTTVGFLLTGLILFFSQDVIDAQLHRANQIAAGPNRQLVLCQQAQHNNFFIQANSTLQLPAGAWSVVCSGRPCTRTLV